MRNIYLTFFVFFTVLNFGTAQTNPYTYQYINNPFVLNPARAGFIDGQFDESYKTKAFLSTKHQWGTIPGFHSSQILTTDIAIDFMSEDFRPCAYVRTHVREEIFDKFTIYFILNSWTFRKY